jgi:hypothetical protein
MYEFEDFKAEFIEWSFDAEKIQTNNLPLCPYAKHTRITNNVEFFDGRENLKECLLKYTGEKDMGVIWLGNNIDVEDVNIVLTEQQKINANIIYFLTEKNVVVQRYNFGFISKSFTNTIIMHRYDDYLIKQRSLFEKKYYDQYPDNSTIKQRVNQIYNNIYPVKKQDNQVIGTESQYKIFDYYFDEPGSVLDIGGNAGNLLTSKNKKIEKYTCLDVSKDAAKLGKRLYPNSNFYHYNMYNEYYNKAGNRTEIFPNIEIHDYVFINSVFTSCDLDTIINILSESIKLAKKKIVFSVFDYDNQYLKDKFKIEELKKETNISYSAKSIKLHNINLLKDYIENAFGINVLVDNPCPIDNNFTIFLIER